MNTVVDFTVQYMYVYLYLYSILLQYQYRGTVASCSVTYLYVLNLNHLLYRFPVDGLKVARPLPGSILGIVICIQIFITDIHIMSGNVVVMMILYCLIGD